MKRRKKMGDARKQFVLSDGKGSYFHQWFPIGPGFTRTREQAKRYERREDALRESSQHFGFIGYEPEKYLD